MTEPAGDNLRGPCAVMFADMGGSSRLYDALGNTMALDVIGQCVALLARVTIEHQGRVIKTIGDEIMCVFPDARDAALAASEMQQGVQELDRDPAITSHGLQARVGLHFGMVLDEGDDVFGDTVNTAARISGLCKADQILATEPFVVSLPRELRNVLRYFDEVQLRGKEEIINVYELLWEVSDVTVAAPENPKVARVEHSRCTLEYSDGHIVMNTERPTVTMGRAADVELQCKGSLTSRKHARIECRRGRFILTDQSANGTYVVPDGDETLTLRRDYFTLDGSGLIGLGEVPSPDDPFAIRYRCES